MRIMLRGTVKCKLHGIKLIVRFRLIFKQRMFSQHNNTHRVIKRSTLGESSREWAKKAGIGEIQHTTWNTNSTSGKSYKYWTTKLHIPETQSTKNTVSIRYWTNTPHSLMGHDTRAKVSALQEDRHRWTKKAHFKGVQRWRKISEYTPMTCTPVTRIYAVPVLAEHKTVPDAP